jgi:hypothetical protein
LASRAAAAARENALGQTDAKPKLTLVNET